MAQRSRQVADERRRLRASAPCADRPGATRRRARASRRRCAGWDARAAAGGSRLYLARDGEVDLAELIRAARRGGARLYAPHITSQRRRAMRFVPIAPRTGRSGATGTASTSRERQPALGIAPGHLDIVLMPLVGFDRAWPPPRHGRRVTTTARLRRRLDRRRRVATTAPRRRRLRLPGDRHDRGRRPGTSRSTWS